MQTVPKQQDPEALCNQCVRCRHTCLEAASCLEADDWIGSESKVAACAMAQLIALEQAKLQYNAAPAKLWLEPANMSCFSARKWYTRGNQAILSKA